MGTWLLFAAAAAAQPAATCSSYVGQSITPKAFDAVAAVLAAVPTQKGEYETTEQFEARVAKAAQAVPETVIIPGIFSANYVRYDADAGALIVQGYALKNLNTSYASVFGYGTPFDGKVGYGSDNYDAVVFEQETKTGTYTGANAYGASATITEITRVQKAIFERKAPPLMDDLFANQQADHVIGVVPMGIPEAQAIKASGKVAFVVDPRWPYYAEGAKHWAPNLSSRIDVTNPIKVIIGDIRCGLLTTADNRVVAAFETK